ncbi:hypothetical protein ACW0S9_09420, partial [Fusobacterium polymorphum]
SKRAKILGMKGKEKKDIVGIRDDKNNAYGVAYVQEKEDSKLGRGIGWYTGLVQNTIKFKDIGNSIVQKYYLLHIL